MKKKESKAEFKCMMSHFNVLARKFCDVWFCQYSHRQQYKSDALPDHMIVRCGQSYFVEVKQSNEHWNFASRNGAGIRDIQRRTLDEWEKGSQSMLAIPNPWCRQGSLRSLSMANALV